MGLIVLCALFGAASCLAVAPSPAPSPNSPGRALQGASAAQSACQACVVANGGNYWWCADRGVCAANFWQCLASQTNKTCPTLPLYTGPPSCCIAASVADCALASIASCAATLSPTPVPVGSTQPTSTAAYASGSGQGVAVDSSTTRVAAGAVSTVIVLLCVLGGLLRLLRSRRRVAASALQGASLKIYVTLAWGPGEAGSLRRPLLERTRSVLEVFRAAFSHIRVNDQRRAEECHSATGIEPNAEAAMKQCDFFLVFHSEAYHDNAQCRAEYELALASSKHILHVNVGEPGYMPPAAAGGGGRPFCIDARPDVALASAGGAAWKKSGKRDLISRAQDIIKDLCRSYVFLSHQWGSKPLVEATAAMLALHGIPCWLDTQEMKGGDSWTGNIGHGISDCAALIVFLSKEYLDSINCHQEVELAFNLKKPIVVIRLSTAPWPIDPRSPDAGTFAAQMAYILTPGLYLGLEPGATCVPEQPLLDALEKQGVVFPRRL